MKYIILFVGLVAICKGSSFSGRIINSIPSAPDDGYAVAIYSAASNNPFPTQSYLSTGAAISSQYVVASGQAIYGFGAWRIGINSNSRALHDIIEVSEPFLHGDFDPLTLQYNIGVFRVSNPISVFLPVADTYPSFPILFTIGFGYSTDDNTLPTISQQAAIQELAMSECRLEFNQRVVRSYNMCGNSVALLASGDQGGPVVDFLRAQIFGIVSYWNVFNVTHNPVVFTSLTDPEIQSFLQPFL